MRVRSATLSVIALSLTATGALAQQRAPEVGFSAVPFNFSPPGARSLGMGGSFIGVADDATAAASNPAGLIILTKPEFSAHMRYTKTSDVEGTAQGEDRFGASFGGSRTSPSFFSAVYPKGNAAFSAFYQQVANFSTATFVSGPYDDPLAGGTLNVASFSGIDLKLQDIGASGAYRFGNVSVGASVVQRKMTLDFYSDLQGPTNDPFYDYSYAVDEDTTLAFNAGVLVNPNGKFSFGATYKRGGEFEFPYGVFVDFPEFGDAFCDGEGCPVAGVSVPDSFGVGFGYRPSETVLIAADATFVQYSKLGETILRRTPLDLFPPVSNQRPPADFDDVVEMHAGAEKTFAGSTPFSVRAGVFHRPNFNSGGTIDAGATFLTFGAGAVFGRRFQVDAAGSISDAVKEGLVSFVVRM